MTNFSFLILTRWLREDGKKEIIALQLKKTFMSQEIAEGRVVVVVELAAKKVWYAPLLRFFKKGFLVKILWFRRRRVRKFYVQPLPKVLGTPFNEST